MCLAFMTHTSKLQIRVGILDTTIDVTDVIASDIRPVTKLVVNARDQMRMRCEQCELRGSEHASMDRGVTEARVEHGDVCVNVLSGCVLAMLLVVGRRGKNEARVAVRGIGPELIECITAFLAVVLAHVDKGRRGESGGVARAR